GVAPPALRLAPQKQIMPSLRSEKFLLLAAAYGLALRGRCPLARFACLPHVRHVAGVHGGRASPYFMPPTTKRWSLRPASRVRLRPKCSPVRCSGCALALRVRLPLSPLTLSYAQSCLNGKGVK